MALLRWLIDDMVDNMLNHMTNWRSWSNRVLNWLLNVGFVMDGGLMVYRSLSMMNWGGFVMDRHNNSLVDRLRMLSRGMFRCDDRGLDRLGLSWCCLRLD